MQPLKACAVLAAAVDAVKLQNDPKDAALETILAAGPADPLTYHRWWQEQDMEEVYTEDDRVYDSEAAAAERERLAAQESALQELREKYDLIADLGASAETLSASADIATALTTMVGHATEADGIFRHLETFADAEGISAGESVISDINAAIQRVRDALAAAEAEEARHAEFDRAMGELAAQIAQLHAGVLAVDGEPLDATALEAALDAVGGDVNAADSLWNGRPTDYDVEYAVHEAVVGHIVEMREHYEHLASLLEGKRAQEAREQEEREEAARYDQWLVDMEDMGAAMQGALATHLQASQVSSGASVATYDQAIAAAQAGITDLDSRWEHRPDAYAALDHHVAEYQDKVAQLTARIAQLGDDSAFARSVEDKAREDAVRCSQEVPAGRFELMSDYGQVPW